MPEILGYVRALIDATPGRKGRWFLTGSQEASLTRGVSESMAGRAAVFQLLPLALAESPKVTPLRGGFPEILAAPSAAQSWFRSYVQTYLERDVRAVSSIRDLATFRRFLGLAAGRCRQIVNRTELAAPLGVSVPTISEWLRIGTSSCISPYQALDEMRSVSSAGGFRTGEGGLGYDSSNTRRDGAWRSIRLICKREGYTTYARKLYYASKE